MKNRREIIFFWSIIAAGLIVHVIFWFYKRGMHYPDEIFQYIEPAFVRLKGFGWLPWEFNRGVRNWTLIGFYGGWMKIFMAFGAEGAWLHRLISLHNTILALAVVPAALRLGRLYGGEVGGWTAAALCALFPSIIFFTPHPLGEVPSMVLSTWGLALWLEGRGSDREHKFAFLAGVLLGMSVVIRFFAGVLVIIPLLDYFVRIFRKKKGFVFYALGGLVALAVLGLTDWLTWGVPFHSAIEYFRYNILEWGNVHHGTSPWWQYFGWMLERINWGLILFIPFFIIGAWRTRLLVATCALGLLTLSLIAHKEERFILGLLPLFLITFSAGIAQASAWMKDRRWFCVPAALIAGAVITATSAVGVAKLEWHWLSGYFDAQAYVGKQDDVSGCMFKGRLHLSGGSTYINKNIPMDSYQPGLSRNPLFNYFIFPEDSPDAALARKRKWMEKATFDDLIVFQKPRPTKHAPKSSR